MRRLRSLWTKLSQNPKLLSEYNETVKTKLQDGIIEIADNKNIQDLVHYLPHQPVIIPNKTTTKLRVVYDASAHTSSASLNEALLKRPVLLPDLCGILLRSRQHKYVLTADIKKGFLQIEIYPKDRDVTRFLWLKTSNLPPENNNLIVYRFERLSFSVICSPFLLAAVLEKHITQANIENYQHLLSNT